MALHFSANQYEEPFKPKRLGNWEIPLYHKEFPDTREGFTQIIANDRGHLLEGVPKTTNAWGDFVGTWDMPRKFNGNITTYMGRTEEAADEIRAAIGQPLNKSTNKSFHPIVPELTRYEKYRKTDYFCIPAHARLHPYPDNDKIPKF